MERITGRAMLIKFKSEDIIDSLQSGCIYMNSLRKFREIERDTDDDKVGDWFDGLMHINDGYLIVEEPQFRVQQLKDAGIRIKYSEDYCYCFFGMNKTNYHPTFTDEQKEKFGEMGEYALIILDYEEFGMINPLEVVVDADEEEISQGLGYTVLTRTIQTVKAFLKYYDPSIDSFNVRQLLEKDGLKMIPMLKRQKYEFQQEFRIVIHAPNENKEHIEIDIGNILDISKKIKADTILNATIVPASVTETDGGN